MSDDRHCVQCKRKLPDSAFLKMPRRYRVKKCMDCAHANMLAWERSKDKFAPKKGYNPADHVTDAGD
jgi:hypothetical protein